jgi:hypothetical protein
MSFSMPTPFPFQSLPTEIRYKIYRKLLCDFKPRSNTFDVSSMLGLVPAHHGIDTAILRTNTAIYREAYDVMIKTNRFVKVTSIRGLPLQTVLNGLQVPIVSWDENKVKSFNGYVLAVDIGCARSLQIPQNMPNADLLNPCTLMILHRDMEVFCNAFTDGDARVRSFSKNVQISMVVAPILSELRLTRYSPSFEDYFSKTTQKTLLAPFRTILRGYKAVQIQGRVDHDLAIAVQEDINRDRWSDPEAVLADFAASKDTGLKLFQQRKADDGCLVWQDAALDIDKMVQSSSWPSLVKRGGQRFVSHIAEMYFLVRLNIAHVQIFNVQRPDKNPYFAGIMAEDALNSAIQSLRSNYWMEGYRHRPLVQHLVKLRYRFALFLRLQAEPGTADRAWRFIEGAMRLQPGNSAIAKERDNILAWLQRGY